jgi:hypothetical protein
MKIKNLYITAETIEERYKLFYSQWLFDFSDEVLIDGELTPKDERRAIARVGYNIRPIPKKIEVNAKIKGFDVGELDFINSEIDRLEKIQPATQEARIQKDRYLEFIRAKKIKPEAKKKSITPEKIIIGLFIQLLNDARIEVQGNGGADKFCLRICQKYGWEYTDSIRQGFGKSRTSKQLDKIKEQIFPIIDTDTKQRIEQYLQDKQKLYG